MAEEPKYRYQQVNKFIFQDYISSWKEASSLPKELRNKLEDECPLEIPAQLIVANKNSNTKKALITLEDGEMVETVLIEQSGHDFVANDKKAEKFSLYGLCFDSSWMPFRL